MEYSDHQVTMLIFLGFPQQFFTINNKNKFHIIWGDININILSDNSNATNYLNIMSKHVFSLL